ncbi:DNA internalization-related competence protein ComEC/Rec2 [Ligilactobacillus sp.]|uniref:DNA internalization-related competence protein ComEC/Rec2 n=1 Tax=Ligilactobacillus sp. TaxID=2767921 RepID=UPI002FE0EF8A
MLGDKRTFFVCLLGCLIFTVRFAQWQRDYQEDIRTCQTNSVQHFLIYADKIAVDGNLMKCDAFWVEKREELKLTAFLKNEEQQKELKSTADSFTIECQADVTPVNQPTNENEFDYRKYCQSQNIFLSAFIKDWCNVKKVDSSQAFKPVLFLHDFRKRCALSFQKLPEPLDWYAMILLLGMRTDDLSDVYSSIKKLGLLYIFCLSGMHVFYLSSFLCRFVQKFGIDYETGQLFNLIVLPCFILVGGGSPSLIRAVMMNVLVIGCNRLLKIKLTPLTAWSYVLLINLMSCPRLLFGFGTQLSYLLTLAIILQKGEKRIAASLKINLLSLPIVLYQTYQWNIFTCLFSLMILPLFECIILPATVLGVVIPGRFFSSACALVLRTVSNLLQFLAELPGNIVFGKPSLTFVLMMLFLAAMTETAKNGLKLWIMMITCYGAMFLAIHFPLSSEIVYFDIGQGDCTLIRSRFNREIIMIDTGGKVSFNTQKWQKRKGRTNGETIVANYLLSKGVKKIDRLYLTHQDADHVANFPSISQTIEIKQVIVPRGMENLASFKKRIEESAIGLESVRGVTTQDYDDSDNLRLLHPSESGRGTNDDSLVLWYDFNGIKCIFTGDLPQAGEKEVIAKHPEINADILKTGHHGSKTSTSPEFVRRINPKLAIISCGRNNRYGHPNQETLKTLNNAGIPYLSTANYGMIKLRKNFAKMPYLCVYGDGTASRFNLPLRRLLRHNPKG